MRDRTEERRIYREKNREILREKNREYYKNNKNKVLERTKQYKQKNSDTVKKMAKIYREKNKEKINEFRKNNREYLRKICRDYQKQNKGLFSAKNAKRKVKKLKATAPWLTEFDNNYITSLYAQARWLTQNTGVEYHIDHVYPLQGKTVSGLHVPTNLQILEAFKNLQKSNKF